METLAKLYLSISILLLCSQISCTSPVTKEEIKDGRMLIVCNTDHVNRGIKKLLLSELVDSLEFIKLATKENSYVKRIKKVSVSKNYIGILDDGEGSKQYKLFRRNGDFVNTIGTIGKGPFEYLSLSDAQIDEANEKIYLMRFSNNNELLCFDLDGNNLESIPLAYDDLSKPKFFVHHDTITCFQIPLTNRSVVVFRQDTKGRAIDHIPATLSMYAKNYDGEIFVNQNTGDDEFFYTAIDTLFHYNHHRNTLIPVFHAKFSQPAIHTYTETPGFFIIWIYGDNHILINKQSLKTNYFEFENNIMGIPIKFYRFDNGHIIFICEAFEFKDWIKNGLDQSLLSKEMKKRLRDIDIQTNEEDNPILMIGKLKG